MFNFFKKLFGSGNDEQLIKALASGGVILDVRTKAEFQRGHIDGSTNIPLSDLQRRLEEVRKWKKPVITVCQSGNRSGVAQKMLNEHNIETYNGGSWFRLNNKLSK